ncbi:hypothetical protein MMC25_007526, partial [Agyrium rufum]|nr:hypothetical protein [Agyrium rufum]
LTPAYSTSSADPSFPKTKYLIQSQEDLYQSDQVILFGSMLRIVWAFVILCQFMASLLCVLGAIVGAPVSWLEENYKTTWRRLGEKTTSGMIVREEQEKDTERTRRRELDEGPPKVEEVL